jgi:maltose alpha-D-glucosyltransferase/alpha-amylase
VPNQGDGWSYTLDALDRYYERVLAARADVSDPKAVTDMIGGVYPERARQLGLRTGEMHIALTGSDDQTAFAPEAFSTLYQRSLYQALRGSVGRTLRMLKRQLPHLSEAGQEAASRVLSSQQDIIGRYARLLDRKIEATKIPIHGDYHLGQVLNTGKDFLIIDFEGEPRRALGERNLKRSPLVDVAGMLRSFDYAAYVGLTRQRAEDAKLLEPWAEAWSQAIAQTFLAAYREATQAATFLPPDSKDFNVLLESFILDKAIYEIGYEITYRPDWVQVPVRAVMRLVQPASAAPASANA